MKDVFLVNYTGRKGGGPIDAYEMAKALIDEGVTVVAIISRQADNLEAWKGLKLEKLVIIDTYNNIFQYMINTSLFPFRQAREIKELSKAYRIRDVYCPMMSGWAYTVTALFKDSRKSLVIHDPSFHPGEKLKYAGLKKMYGKFDVLFVHSRKYVDPVRRLYGKPTYYFPLGRHNYYKICENKKVIVTYDSNRINYLFFGRVLKYKRLDMLASAYREIREETDLDATLTIVGNGDFEPYRAMYANLPDVTIVNRWIEDSEVESVFSGDNIICVCPYQGATQSGVILVAMDYGAALIVSDSGAMDEQVEDGRTGLVFKEGDVKDLAKKMYTLARDEKLRNKLVNSAREEIEKCTWSNSAKDLIKALNIRY